MEYIEISNKVKKILIDTLELSLLPEDINEQDVIFNDDLNADSIAALEIVTNIEDNFGFVFEDSEISADMFSSVKNLTDIVFNKLN